MAAVLSLSIQNILVILDADLHLVGEGDLTAQYTLVLDALNFCFWPEEGLEYEHMARGLKVTSTGRPLSSKTGWVDRVTTLEPFSKVTR